MRLPVLLLPGFCWAGTLMTGMRASCFCSRLRKLSLRTGQPDPQPKRNAESRSCPPLWSALLAWSVQLGRSQRAFLIQVQHPVERRKKKRSVICLKGSPLGGGVWGWSHYHSRLSSQTTLCSPFTTDLQRRSLEVNWVVLPSAHSCLSQPHQYFLEMTFQDGTASQLTVGRRTDGDAREKGATRRNRNSSAGADSGSSA